MKSKKTPSNRASLICAHCGTKLEPATTLAADNEGVVHLVNVDTWPLYYWDTMLHRDEFCGAACVESWLSKKSQTKV